MIYLTAEELLHAAKRVCGYEVVIRDAGLLESAAARPSSTLFGNEVYPDILLKAASLTQSLVCNHPLVDGNKRLALAGLIAFLGVNGYVLSLTNNEAYSLIVKIATRQLTEVADIASEIHVEKWR